MGRKRETGVRGVALAMVGIVVAALAFVGATVAGDVRPASAAVCDGCLPALDNVHASISSTGRLSVTWTKFSNPQYFYRWAEVTVDGVDPGQAVNGIPNGAAQWDGVGCQQARVIGVRVWAGDLVTHGTSTTQWVTLDAQMPPSCAFADTSTVTVSSPTVTEGDSGTVLATFTVTADWTADPQTSYDFTYAAANGTPRSPGDYVPVSGSLSFAGTTRSQDVTVAVIGDTMYEFDETLYLIVSDARGRSTASGTATIVDDDPRPVVVGGSVVEGNAGSSAPLDFTVSMESPVVATTTLLWFTDWNTHGNYVDASGSVTFEPGGPTEQTVTITVLGDDAYEPAETIALTVRPVASGATTSGLGTVVNDDAPPVITVGPATLTEGNARTTNAVFPVTLTGGTRVPACVSATTVDGTAVAPDDYTASTLSVCIPAGSTSGSITVPVVGDKLDEADETFDLALTATDADLAAATATATATIVDNDPQPSVSVKGRVQVVEGNTGTTPASFTFTLSKVSGQPVTVSYTTLDGTAKAGSDYAAATATATIPAGVQSTTVSVDVLGDTSWEKNETVKLRITAADHANLGGTTSLDTIMDDDGPPTLTIADASAPEGTGANTQLVFTMSLSDPSSYPTRVTVATSSASAVVGMDYVGMHRVVTIPAGQTTATVAVTIVADGVLEGDETFHLDVGTTVNATVGTPYAVGTIVNDD